MNIFRPDNTIYSDRSNEQGFVLPLLLLLTGLVSSLVVYLSSRNQSGDDGANEKVIADGMILEAERPEPPFAAVADLLDSEPSQPEELVNESPQTTYSLASSPAMATIGESISKRILQDNREKPVPTTPAPTPRSEIVTPPVQIISTKELGLTKEQILAQLAAPFVSVPQQPKPAESVPTPVKPNPTTTASFVQDTSEQNIIRGFVELQKGLALIMESDRIYVYREERGRMIEQAAVSTREAAFEILVDQPVGDLVAELRTGHGHLLGRGRLALANLAKATKYHGDVKILIDPVTPGLKGHAWSLAQVADADRKPAVAARLAVAESPIEMVSMRDGRFSEPNLAEGSMAIVKAELRQHWSSIAPICTSSERDLPIYKEAALAELLKLAPGSEAKSVVIGTVTRSLQPAPGAQIDMPTANTGSKTIYFNAQNQPDPGLTSTSTSGMFAVINLDPGLHTIISRIDTTTTQPQLVVADGKQVSPVQVETEELRRAEIRLYDAFRTNEPLRGIVRHYGAQLPAATIGRSGKAQVSIAAGDQWLVTEAESSKGYMRSRVVSNRDQQVIYYPMIPLVWMAQLQGEMRINQMPQTGTVIGFIQGYQKYQIVMDELALGRATRVIYFDQNGRPINSKFGLPGGGFALFNVPEGIRTIAVQPDSSQRYYLASTLVDSHAVAIINHSIR